ncbi:MAG: porin [Bacteroidota bacterium]
MKQIFSFFVFLFFTGSIISQEDTLTKNLEFNTYGIFRAHLAAFNGETEIQDASPRVGFEFDYYFGENEKFKVYFGGEFAVNLIDNQFSFQADPNTSNDGFTILEFSDKKSTFSTRLGFLGVDFAEYGNLTIGKLNSVYKDVAGKTDIFNVISAQASYVYSPTGGDGGETGTGRAESAIIYRNSFWKFDVGLQTQMRARGGSNIFDNYGASLRLHLTDHLTLGTAYNKALLGPKFLELPNLQGLEGDPIYFTAGIDYKNGPLLISAIYASQKNGDFVNIINPETEELESIVYPGKGYEIVATYSFMNNHLKVLAGINYEKPESDNRLLPKDFSKRFYLLGAQYHFLKYASVYSEYRYNNKSFDESGAERSNVFVIGLRIDFDKTWSKHINLIN